MARVIYARDNRLGIVRTVFEDCMVSTRCPTCEAKPGAPCEDISTPHLSRLDAYNAEANIAARIARTRRQS